MKNKKIIATVVALASFLAMATSGLAAATVSTTAAYSGNDLEVDVSVTGVGETDEVTYLVKSMDAKNGVSGNTDKIVYINQITGNKNFSFVVDEAYAGILSVTSNRIEDTDVVVAPGAVTISKISVANPDVVAKATTTYIKLTGNVNEFGVTYGGKEYPAVKVDGVAKETTAGIYAITLVGTDAAPATDAIIEYYK